MQPASTLKLQTWVEVAEQQGRRPRPRSWRAQRPKCWNLLVAAEARWLPLPRELQATLPSRKDHLLLCARWWSQTARPQAAATQLIADLTSRGSNSMRAAIRR